MVKYVIQGGVQYEIMRNGIINNFSNNLILVNEIIKQFRRQDFHAALRKLNLFSKRLIETVQSFVSDESLQQYEIDMESFAAVLSGVLEAQEKEDYILVADLLELQIVPWLQQIQELLISEISLDIDDQLMMNNMEGLKKVNLALAGELEKQDISSEYIVEPTSSGLLTLQVTDGTGTYYFHSNNNPALEGNIFAEQYYSLDCSHYVVFGLGLGYHIKALLNMDDGLYIDIVEPDLSIIKVAVTMTDMTWLYTNPRIRLIYDKNYIKLKDLLETDKQFLIHYPSLRHITDTKIKEYMERFFINDSRMRDMRIQFENNFRDNVVNCDDYVDVLEDKFSGKNAIIVAAGPSLDKNVELLRNVPKNTIIVAVGTIFRKLIHMGIRPDFVIFLDAQAHLHGQIGGVEHEEVPIICASTACRRIAELYQGKKYLICQKGYDRAETYAKERGYRLYESGGSVSTIALDMCLQLGCKSIAYVGLDLAFTNNHTHAAGTLSYGLRDEKIKVYATSIDGGNIASCLLFTIYREWIERRVARIKNGVEVIDATEGGARKKGLVRRTLQETFDLWTEE